jgi:hypothetical protein
MLFIFEAFPVTSSHGVVQVATAAHPAGPWALADRNLTLRWPIFTSVDLFVDPRDGAAYVLYSSVSNETRMGPHRPYRTIPPVVERLAPGWTSATGECTLPAGAGFSGEAEMMFERAGRCARPAALPNQPCHCT